MNVTPGSKIGNVRDGRRRDAEVGCNCALRGSIQPSSDLSHRVLSEYCGSECLAPRHPLGTRLAAVCIAPRNSTHPLSMVGVVLRGSPLKVLNPVVGFDPVDVVNLRLSLGGLPEKRQCYEAVNRECASPVGAVQTGDRVSGASGAAGKYSPYPGTSLRRVSPNSAKARHGILREPGTLSPFFGRVKYDLFSHCRVSPHLRDSGGQGSPAVSAAVGLARYFTIGGGTCTAI